MTLFSAIKQSQSQLKQLAAAINADHRQDVTTLLSSLQGELNNIEGLAKQLSTEKAKETSAINGEPVIDKKSGCYVFANEKGFFCPHCYDNFATKIATKRMNSKLRVCPQCRSSIK